MKVALYTPYLDTFGGGERYVLTIAEVLQGENEVDLLIDTHLQTKNIETIKETLTKRLNINLSNVNFVNAPIGAGSTFWQRYTFLKQYDLLIALTDGSIFYSTAKKSILHIQTPLAIDNSGLGARFKLSSWDSVIYNSHFTQTHAQKYWPLPSEVVYPPVDTTPIRPLKKQKIILSVGRFFGFLREKKHATMIEAFKQLQKEKALQGWRLVLAGSAGEGDMGYIEELEDLSEGCDVELRPNIPYNELLKHYGEASIYWHAMGYGEDDPTKSEHFGITTVEAMAGGAVPVVINKGGQPEIVEDTKSGFLWDTTDTLQEITLQLVNDEKLLQKVSQNAQQRAHLFSKQQFKERIESLLPKK